MKDSTRLFGIKQLKYVAWVIFSLAIMFASVTQARAHGIGTPQVINAPAGPYLISIWTDPDPLRVGEAHVTVAVTDPETESPVLDASVMVQLVLLDEPSVSLSAPATSENAALKIVYVAVFEPEQAGRWQGMVIVDGTEGTSEAVKFDFSVLPPAPVNWGLVGSVSIGLLTLGWMARLWFGSDGENGR
jgi:hypothetical protein